MKNADLPHVIIIGGGFGGLYAARALKGADVRITLIDRQNHHLFQPLLYQVATSALSSADIAAPIRKILRKQSNVTVLLTNVESIDVEKKKVLHTTGELDYDFLIVAAGARNNYFGNDHWKENAPGLKSLADAVEIRRRVLLAYEAAELATDKVKRHAWLTFVVIGAGPTGVEMAGALKEIAVRTMVHNFRNFDPKEARVILVEGSDRVLNAFPENLSKSALEQLRKLGVDVRLNTMVSDIRHDEVEFQSGEVIPSRTVVWAAGVAASSLGEDLDTELVRGGRVKVEPDMSIPGRDNVFVIGDMAYCIDKDGKEVPGLAPAAMQAGRHVGRQIKRTVAGKEREQFEYIDKGIMATIGRSHAVAKSGPMKLTGFLAWLTWLFIHIIFLAGFRNRIAVMMEWAWAYISFQRSARIIISGNPTKYLPFASQDDVDKAA